MKRLLLTTKAPQSTAETTREGVDRGRSRRQANARPARLKRVFATALIALFVAANAHASDGQNVPDVTAMSVEDLMNMQVTSVSKRAQKLADAAAAIFVITQEDIQRSGARNIPELLEMVPGLEVARIDENKWAIGARGFNGRFDDKLLVLIDGRSVYTPLFSGVYWDVQDVMLDDVERIEVIRGPGATLWGADAVDGVINIITKPAKDTQSGFIKAGGGDEELTADGIRYGGQVGNKGYYRAYMKGFDWGPSTDLAGQDAYDGWHQESGGFRSDWTLSSRDSLTVQGQMYHSQDGETLTIPSLSAPYSNTFPNTGDYSGGDLLSRWNHTYSNSSISLQAYFDRTNYADNNLFVDHESVYDIEFQHDFHVGERHEFVWGAGYRSIQDRSDSTFTVAVQPSQGEYNLFNAFLQDEIHFLDGRVQLTLGSKLEHNDFTGFEYEPNVRLLVNLSKDQSIWGAISRAVRTPAITEEGLRLNSAVVPPGAPPFDSPLPVIEAIYGNSQFQSEDLLAYEVGYRVQATKTFSADIAAFYNNYTDLLTAEPGTPFTEGNPPTDVVYPFLAENKMSGGTYGVEPFFNWKVFPVWKLYGYYSYLQMNIHKNADSLDPTADLPNGSNPKNQAYFQSSLELPRHIEQHLSVRYVDKLPGIDIPAYTSLDAGVRWSPLPTVTLSFDGLNWLDNRHIEFIPDFINTTPTVVTRSMFGSITLNFGKR
ncbi:MAG: TonB-dependent receptor plug domain-containing protein [Candidatus Acidiferrales bacterium]